MPASAFQPLLRLLADLIGIPHLEVLKRLFVAEDLVVYPRRVNRVSEAQQQIARRLELLGSKIEAVGIVPRVSDPRPDKAKDQLFGLVLRPMRR